MPDRHYEVIEVVSGEAQAEILRGLLEAQGIPVVLSQEGAGHSVFPVTVGRLGKVEILVPTGSSQHAREILKAYHAGEYESSSDEVEEDG